MPSPFYTACLYIGAIAGTVALILVLLMITGSIHPGV